MKYIVIVLLFFSVNVFGQNKTENDTVFELVSYEEMPEFKGGFEPMKKFIDSVMVYPKIGIEKKIEGNVQVQFKVLSTGKLSNIKLARSFVTENTQVDSLIINQFDNEALRIIKLMPDWIPGKEFDKIVDVNKVTVPIKFKLNQ